MCILNAVENNDIKKLRKLISERKLGGISLSEALVEASERGFLEIIKILIEAGANVNQETIDGTPLGQASFEGHFKIVEELLEAKANPNLLSSDREYQTPLIFAAQEGHFEIVKKLVEAGANVNEIRGYGQFALHSAACCGYQEIFDYLYPLTDENLREEALNELSAGLHHRELEENAEPLVVELSHYVLNNDLEEVKRILNKGANVNGIDEFGGNALSTAAFKANIEIVRILLEAGANPNLISDGDDGDPPLWFANSAEVTKLLIDAGANTNFQNSSGDTILIITARRWGAFKKMKVLLENGADTNIKDNEGKTALMYAAKDKDNLEKVKLLIEFGADINTKDNDGNTALSLAREVGSTKIAKLLVEAGAK